MEFITPDKGWERLLFDLGDKKIEVIVHTLNKSMQGLILKVQSGVLVFEEHTDRFRKNVTYVPLSHIVSVSSNFQ